MTYHYIFSLLDLLLDIYHPLPCHYFMHVNCMLPIHIWLYHMTIINHLVWLVTCYISSPYHAITLYPAWYTWLVIVIFTGTLTCYLVSWSVTCFPALHAVTWLYSTCVLLNSWSCLFPVISRKVIIKLMNPKKDNLYGYGRKWWMPEWYLAYSMGIGLAVVNLLLNRGTLGLQNWSQVYGNYYKKWYQFSIYFR